MAGWAPEGGRGATLAVAAFAEQGKTPRVPGPLLRVRTGTVIDAAVRNALPDSTITVHGLATHPAAPSDGLVIAPGQTARVRFAAGTPGTYLYYAEAGRQDTLVEREQLAGAFVVDSAASRPDDRVFVINIWGQPGDSATYRNALAINGRSFPFDERITTQVGDTLRWHVINASLRNHPMHLHGFYFRVDAKGDSVYGAAARRMAVTENLPPRSTMSIAWGPDRPGNWLFHCHLMFHALGDARLTPWSDDPHHKHDADIGRHMAGLVLGIEVRPGRGWRDPSRESPRKLRLFVQEGRPRSRAPRAMGFVLQRGEEPPRPDSVEVPGSVLVLTRGEPTHITVINRLGEPAAVHWHGLELESWSDGVAGWSGSGHRMAPAIQPGDSFTARLTLRRAGTFIYHTHLNDFEQLTSGLYGAMVVLEPGQRFDPATDHLWVAGWDGPAQKPPHIVVNGDSVPAPLELASGVIHRFRFVNIGMAVRLRFAIAADSGLVTWRPVAKDGADLPPSQATPRPAALFLAVGETADAEFLPPAPGAYRLTATAPSGRVVWQQSLVAR